MLNINIFSNLEYFKIDIKCLWTFDIRKEKNSQELILSPDDKKI